MLLLALEKLCIIRLIKRTVLPMKSMCLFEKLCHIPFISMEHWVLAALLTDQKW